MAEGQKKESESGVLGRFAERGEDAITRVLDELGKNPRVTDAMGRAMTAKGKVDDTTRKTLASVGFAASDELKDLRRQVERLEKRLAKLEGAASSSGRSTKSGRKSSTATKASGGTARKTSSKSRSRAASTGSGSAGSPGSGSPA